MKGRKGKKRESGDKKERYGWGPKIAAQGRYEIVMGGGEKNTSDRGKAGGKGNSEGGQGGQRQLRGERTEGGPERSGEAIEEKHVGGEKTGDTK